MKNNNFKNNWSLAALIITIIVGICGIIIACAPENYIIQHGMKELFTQEGLNIIQTDKMNEIIWSAAIILSSIIALFFVKPIQRYAKVGEILNAIVLCIVLFNWAYFMRSLFVNNTNLEGLSNQLIDFFKYIDYTCIIMAVLDGISILLFVISNILFSRFKKQVNTYVPVDVYFSDNNAPISSQNNKKVEVYNDEIIKEQSFENNNQKRITNITDESKLNGINNNIKLNSNNEIDKDRKQRLKDEIGPYKLAEARQKAKQYKEMLDNGKITSSQFKDFMDNLKSDLLKK